MEGTLASGLLYGGVLSYTGSSITASKGSGIIINYSASLTKEISPIISFVTWNEQSKNISSSISSSQATYVYIDSSGVLQTQDDTFFTPAQYQTTIPLGMFNHNNRNIITTIANDVYTAYANTIQAYNFIQAFGPLKISGLSLSGQSCTLRTDTTGSYYSSSIAINTGSCPVNRNKIFRF